MSREVLTSGDICKRFGISRNTLTYWRRQEGFPAPLTYSKARGGVYDAAEVRAWVQAYRRGSPESRAKRVAAVGQFRRGATVSAIARNVGVDRNTVYRWLASAGIETQRQLSQS
jgi:transposase-like protein